MKIYKHPSNNKIPRPQFSQFEKNSDIGVKLKKASAKASVIGTIGTIVFSVFAIYSTWKIALTDKTVEEISTTNSHITKLMIQHINKFYNKI